MKDFVGRKANTANRDVNYYNTHVGQMTILKQ